MSSKKLKPELVAICKLEFYRKQKNWKYYPQERKSKDSKRRPRTNNAKLNQTYNITPTPPEKKEPSEPETPETDDRQILDEAFVDTETGTESDEAAHADRDILNTFETVALTDKPSSHLDPTGSHYTPKWSIQRWAEQHRLWNPEPACPTQEPTCPNQDPIFSTQEPTCPKQDPISPTQEPTCPKQDPFCPTHDPTRQAYHPTYPTQDFLPQERNPSEDANCPIFDNNYNKIQDVYYSNQYHLHYKGTEYPDANYPTQSYQDGKYGEPCEPKYGVSTVYYNSNMCHHGPDLPQSGANILDTEEMWGWEVEAWERCAGEGAVWNNPDWLGEAAAVGAGGEDAVDGDWRLLDLSGLSRSDSLMSVASSEFIRGAALAPHSTQIDLLVGPEPARLPPAALAAAVARHSAALRALLHETQRRQQGGAPELPDVWDKVTKEPHSPDHSVDEIPVRDPGPAWQHPLFNDRIVAGSRLTPDLRGQTGQAGSAGESEVGRGRGRLKVGIRMGRPYRL